MCYSEHKTPSKTEHLIWILPFQSCSVLNCSSKIGMSFQSCATWFNYDGESTARLRAAIFTGYARANTNGHLIPPFREEFTHPWEMSVVSIVGIDGRLPRPLQWIGLRPFARPTFMAHRWVFIMMWRLEIKPTLWGCYTASTWTLWIFHGRWLPFGAWSEQLLSNKGHKKYFSYHIRPSWEIIVGTSIEARTSEDLTTFCKLISGGGPFFLSQSSLIYGIFKMWYIWWIASPAGETNFQTRNRSTCMYNAH